MQFPSISSVPTCTSSNADHLINRLYIRTSVFVSFETTFNIQHGVRIEAVATSLQQGESTDRIQQFPAYILSKVELQFY